MSVQDIILVIQLLMTVLQTAATGTKEEKDVAIAAGLQEIMTKIYVGYQAQVGKPMDLSLLKPEDPIV